MRQRHSNELCLRLDRVLDMGCAEISKPEMLRWYEVDAMDVKTWSYLRDAWFAVARDAVPLFVGETATGYVLLRGDGLSTTESSWLQPLDKLGYDGRGFL